MEYETKLAPVDKVVVTPSGPLQPLCNSCLCTDCTNPIEEKTISIAGVLSKSRLWVEKGTLIRQVVECKGYLGNATPSVESPS